MERCARDMHAACDPQAARNTRLPHPSRTLTLGGRVGPLPFLTPPFFLTIVAAAAPWLGSTLMQYAGKR